MGEYEERYPDAFGRGEETETEPKHRPFRGLPRQVRSEEPVPADAPTVAEGTNLPNPPVAKPAPVHHEPLPRRVFVERPAADIRANVEERLKDAPYVDASTISVAVDGSEVRLDGTVSTLFAVSVARSLASNVPGVSRVQVQLRVAPAPRGYEMAPDNPERH
jgi:BON domain-containing protein